MKMMPYSICLALLLTPVHADAAPLAARNPVRIPRSVGYFDYMLIDQQRRRLVLAHTESQAVAFVNLDSGALERQLYIGAAPHGIAIDESDGLYYVGTSGAQHGAVAIDRASLRVLRWTRTPGPVDALAFDSRRRTLYADADDGDSIWLIAAPSGQIITTLHTPRDSDKAEYDPRTDRVYQNFTTTNSVMVIHPARHVMLASWSTLPATRPHGLAVDIVRRILFIAGVNGKLAALDISTGRLLYAIDIAPHVDQIAIDVARRRVYCASGDGFISVVDIKTPTPRLLANVAVPRGAHTVALDQASGAVWISYGTDRDDFVMRLDPPAQRRSER